MGMIIPVNQSINYHLSFMRLSYCSFIIISLLASLPAAASAPAPAASGPTYNFTLILLVSIAVVFAFAIALLGYVLKHLSLAYMDKWRKEKATGKAIKSVVLLLVALLPAFSAMAEEAVVPVVESPFIAGVPRGDFYFISGVLAFEVMIMLILLWQIFRMSNLLRDVPEKAPVPSLLKKNILDVFNKSVAVKDEASITMDHEYDGIRELDNDLPPWWKWGFVMTIIFSVIYLGYYHAAGGPNQAEEFRIAMEKAEAEKAEYLAKAANNVDENTVTMVTDEMEIGSAKNIFETTCAACHAKDGGGTVGPNLTDDYWLHGGDIKDVFKSVKYGWPDKGMKSWKDDYSPKQIAALASYIKTLRGTKPAAPKAPQGELFKEGASSVATAAITDTVAK